MRTKQGIVVKKSGIKTISVEIQSSRQHPLYKKRFRVSKKFLVHDEKEQYKVGDVVTIYEVRPLSARKRFTVDNPEAEAKRRLSNNVASGHTHKI